MKSQRRRLVVGFICGLLFGLSGLLFWLRSDRSLPLHVPSQLGSPGHRARIDSFVKVLQSESFAESCSKVLDKDDSQFFYPGFVTGRKAHQVNLEFMLSNRRCVKIIDEIERMRDQVRDGGCSAVFKRCLDTHASAMRAAIRHKEDPTSPANTQSLKATQLSLCAIMFATAKSASTQTVLSQFDAIQAFGDEIERRMGQSGNDSDGFNLFTRKYSMPDNRFQLNVLYCHASRLSEPPLTESVEQITAEFPTSSVPIVAWRAATTWFDVVHRMEGVPLDETHGVEILTFLDWPEDMAYDGDGQRQVIRMLVERLRARASPKVNAATR